MTTELAPAAKGGRLHGGALTQEALESSPSVLRSYRGRSTTGLQQFFTPPTIAGFIADVLGRNGCVFDPTAGSGALLRPWPHLQRFGVEIDADHINPDVYRGLAGDIQIAHPLFRLADLRFDTVVANPPFGLDWTDGTGKHVSSTLHTMHICVELLADGGHGAMIAGRDRYMREVHTNPIGRHAWALVEIPDLFGKDVDLPCVVAFFAQETREADPHHVTVTAAELGDIATVRRHTQDLRAVSVDRFGYRHPSTSYYNLQGPFDAVRREYLQRTSGKRRWPYEVNLAGRRVRVSLGPVASLILNKAGKLRDVGDLNGKPVGYFALHERTWHLVEKLAADGHLTVDPELAPAIAASQRLAERSLVPMYPLPPQQRLGWLDRDGSGQEEILCTTSDPDRGFVSGERYPVRTQSRIHTEEHRRVEESRGEVVIRRVRHKAKVLDITVGTESFTEAGGDLQYLIDHFQMPDPGDLATLFPDDYNAAVAVLEQLASDNNFTFRDFQLQDLARLLVKGYGLIGHEVGLGKTLFLLSLAAAHARMGMRDLALFVFPQDLEDQWQAETARFFGRRLEMIRNPADARRVAAHVKAGGTGWYGIYYEVLSVIGRKVQIAPERVIVSPAHYARMSVEQRAGAVKNPKVTDGRMFSTRESCPSCVAPRKARRDGDTWTGWDGRDCTECGHSDVVLKTKSAAHALSTVFADALIGVDEISLAAGESLRSEGLAALRGRHRYGASGTPIKNFIDDLYRPLWWLVARHEEQFPYPLSDGGREKFQRDFCVTEELFGKRDEDAHKVVRQKILPRVTNLSMLWRLLCSGMVRRRKEDTGEPLVPKTIHIIETPPGEQQLAQHGEWLKKFVGFFTERNPDHSLVQAGVVERFQATLGLLWKLEYASTHPEADPDADWTGQVVSSWTPANLKTLETAMRHARLGKKVVIFSDLVDTGVWLCERLRERGIAAGHIVDVRTGQTKAPKKRAQILDRFKAGDIQVLCAGIQAIRQGHNFDMAQVAIVQGLPYSYETLEQALGRVHRLTSKLPVDVYVIYPKGMLGQTKWHLIGEKGMVSDLALDGRLIEEDERPVNWQQVLEEMQAAGAGRSSLSAEAILTRAARIITSGYQATPTAIDTHGTSVLPVAGAAVAWNMDGALLRAGWELGGVDDHDHHLIVSARVTLARALHDDPTFAPDEGRDAIVAWQETPRTAAQATEIMRAAAGDAAIVPIPEADILAIWQRAEGDLAPVGTPADTTTDIPAAQQTLSTPDVVQVAVEIVEAEWDRIVVEETDGQLSLAIF